MANLSRPSPARQILAREPARSVRLPGRRAAIGAMIALVLAALAWFDGGEEEIRPIAQEIVLPGAAQ
ncbi:hypothetical protein [Erythrobacter tepidarius]|uniref:hypothetical protein n=1 Tax=Erythrobacter tepidarius TaxID=60454 RepID=UPI000A38C27D|nr:hypothetical protein [Erythrobacter tepidarius]